MSEKVKRTMVSQQAMEMSQLLTLRFARQAVGSEVPKRLTVQAPDGPSTEGGKRARQSIVLTPVDEGAPGAVMCGWLDIAQRAAELRTHAVVSQSHEDRYHKPLDVAQEQYDALMTDVLNLLSSQAFHTNIVDIADAGARMTTPRILSGPPPASKGSALMWAAVALGAVGLGLIAYLLFTG